MVKPWGGGGWEFGARLWEAPGRARRGGDLEVDATPQRVIPEFAERMSGTRLVSAGVWVPDRCASGMTRGWGSTCRRRPLGLRFIETSQLSALPAQAGTHGGWGGELSAQPPWTLTFVREAGVGS